MGCHVTHQARSAANCRLSKIVLKVQKPKSLAPKKNMDAFEDQPDPAADFLAREQEELGELGEELGISSNAAAAVPAVNIENLSFEDQQELDAVNKEVAQERTTTPSPAFVMPPRPKEEPEKIIMWRQEQAKRLEEKDAKESETMAKLRDEAQQELKEWYKRYEDNLAKTKQANRDTEQEFVAEINDISPGTEWERVTKLCDFSGKNANKNSTKDMSRMKSILINLKAQEMNGSSDKNAS